VQGGLVMLAFGLGTAPMMAGFGFIVNALSASSKMTVFRASAVLVLVLGIALAMNGMSSFVAIPVVNGANPTPSLTPQVGLQEAPTPAADMQVVRNELYGSGYRPATIQVEAGKPARWIIDVKELTGCNNAVKIPSLGIQQQLRMGENVIELPAMEPGTVQYSCWMGMLRGSIRVI